MKRSMDLDAAFSGSDQPDDDRMEDAHDAWNA
jgi:hypothetical protein